VKVLSNDKAREAFSAPPNASSKEISADLGTGAAAVLVVLTWKASSNAARDGDADWTAGASTGATAGQAVCLGVVSVAAGMSSAEEGVNILSKPPSTGLGEGDAPLMAGSIAAGPLASGTGGGKGDVV